MGHGWAARRILLLHAGGYSERSPAHGTLGKAFGQLPMDAAGAGVPATILEAQLVYFLDLPGTLPPGIFVSSADVVLQLGAVPRLSGEERAKAATGLLALGHVSTIETGTRHGVFACDGAQLAALIRRQCAAAAAAPAVAKAPGVAATEEAGAAGSAAGGKAGRMAAMFLGAAVSALGTSAAAASAAAAATPVQPVVVECRRCLQKPTEADMRTAAAVMAPPEAMGVEGGGGGEWVLTDSAFHIGYRACDALVRLAAAHPEELAGVEVCAYGDMMVWSHASTTHHAPHARTNTRTPVCPPPARSGRPREG